MVSRIFRDPIFRLKDFSLGNQLQNYFPFNHGNVFHFAYARIALFEGLRRLRFKEGDSILVPNYICNVILAPLHFLKVEAKFYEVDDQLKPNWKSVREQLETKTKAFFLVHYFGFPNDLEATQAFCREHELFLIEDNTHGFLSCDGDRPLGSFGDISIFSFKKTIPIVFGATLIQNIFKNTKDCAPIKSRLNPSCSFKFLIKSALKHVISYFGFLNGKFPSEKEWEMHIQRDANEEFELEKYFVKLSAVEWFLMSHINMEAIRKERLTSYQLWLDHFASEKSPNATVLFPELPAGVVPFVFPILTENRPSFIQEYWRRGVECYPWPFLPRASHETFFSSRLLCLPVSQADQLQAILKHWNNPI